MPRQPIKLCGHPNCPERTSGRFCKEHARQYEKELYSVYIEKCDWKQIHSKYNISEKH